MKNYTDKKSDGKYLDVKRFSIRFVIIGLAALSGLLACGLQEVQSQETLKSAVDEVKIESRHVDIWSDGTRLSGDLWYPKGLESGDRLPAVILCHGWGGVRSHLNQAYASEFAAAGYVVLTFDYRGWGDSDSRLVIKEKISETDESGLITVRAQAIRELVDPFDQTEDIIHCLDFLSGEPGVDPDRIGLWGTSFGGGHVVYVAALDKRVKCIVSQVPSMDGGWVTLYYQPSKLAAQRARGEIDPVPQNVNKIGRLKGTPYLSRIAKYHPVEFANHLTIPILIIVAEKEELMDNKLHGERVYNIVKGNVPAKYEVFSGTHFEIYGKGRKQANKMAIEWFDKHL
jgi:dienelactone hydrolase